MLPQIAGYRLLTELHRSERSIVYRGLRESDQRSVIIKTLPQAFPHPHDLARIRREHRLLKSYEAPGMLRSLGLEAWENNLALVLEDRQVGPLSAQMVPGEPFSLADFFKLALAAAHVLAELHQHVIHKDLNPQNMLWDSETERIWFVDLSLASEISIERQSAGAPQRLLGSLPYISPEQTGRMNREVDYRTDFYSLGVTFFQLLTGHLPFVAADPLEWIYGHITKVPPHPRQLNPEVPTALGDMVLKLMAKTPEDRYQSAQGLIRDLERCQREWAATGDVCAFDLAQDDVMARFQLPTRLYGRDKESEVLNAAFRAAAAGKPQFVMATGPAGSGKTALVHALSRTVLDHDGFFLVGKFDQFRHHPVPYAALSQALSGLVRQILAEPETRLRYWRDNLLEALGPNGQIGLELVPDLVHVIGPQAPIPSLNPTEEQNRFLMTVKRLISVFARPEHPTVLCLDDLQWGDAPTFRLLQSLLDSAPSNSLLLIGTYRDDDTVSSPQLPAFTELLHAEGVRHLRLAPLDLETLNLIVADAVHAAPEEARALTSIVHAKTDGNPFFAKELLKTWHEDGLLAFDTGKRRWTWSLEALQRARVSEDVVDFLLARLKRLGNDTQSLLQLAACIGSTFDLQLLSLAIGQVPAQVLRTLRPAVTAGLVVPLSDEELGQTGMEASEDPHVGRLRFEFLHDRVRQAAYALVPEIERKNVHLHLGRIMLANTDEQQRAARAPEIAQQLNAGRVFILNEAERLVLANLNLMAARKAKEAAAYRPATDFAEVAREVLPVHAWDQHYELAIDIFKLCATCAYLCGEFDLAERCCSELLARSRTTLEKAEVRAMTAALYSFSDRMDDAVKEGIRALRILGIKLSPNPSKLQVVRELALTKLALGNRRAHDLDDAPLVSDRAIKLAMKILADFMAPAYLTGNDTLFATTMLKQATLSLRHGNCVEAVTAYSCFAVLLAGLGDYQGAYEFGQLALRLTDKFGATGTKSRTLVLYALFSHSWSQPWGQLDEWFKQSVETGLQSGDFLFMAFACGYVHHWDPQIDLATAVAEGRQYLALCKQTHYQNAFDAASCANQFWRALRAETNGPLSLSDPEFDELACMERMQRVRYTSGIAIYHQFKLQVACIHGSWELAWHHLLQGSSSMPALVGSPYTLDYCIHGFLSAAQMVSRPGLASTARRHLRRFHRQMRAWARHCPENFSAHLRLMEAEFARLKGRHFQAASLYDDAIRLARETGFVRYEALANEAAARFYRAHGQERVSRAYAQDARDGYVRWGAIAKVDALDREHPAPIRESSTRLASLAASGLQPFSLLQVPQLVESGMLDLTTIWKATQAISGEVILERLLEKLLSIVKESAGAHYAVLVLKEGDAVPSSLVVRAESHDHEDLTVLQSEPLDDHRGLPTSIIRYVARTQETVLLGDPAQRGSYAQDPYILSRRPKSVLALPIVNQGQLVGVLYLENGLVSDAFTPDRVSVLQILAGQAAVSIQNARSAERAAYLEAERTIKDSYARELELRVEERTYELREAYEQLMELDHMKTNFLSVVSHELRTPLTAIQGYSEFLEDQIAGELTPGQQEYVRQIQQGTLHLGRLVDDLLDFARTEAGTFKLERTRTSLSDTVTEAVESVTPLVQEHRLSLETRLPEAPIWAEADPGRITQVLLNLVGNAIKFTPAGGTIVVSLQRREQGALIEVRDSGIGISPEHLPRLFQKFYQVDSSTTRLKGGAGLGLSIAQSIVEAHGGTMGVDSEPERGSTFWFTLPGLVPPPTLDVAADVSG